MLTLEQQAFVEGQRVAHLATASRAAQPHVIPVCYACSGSTFYIALDDKPKRVTPMQLKRVRNLLRNPQAALVIDRYSETWSELAYLLVSGTAALLQPGEAEHSQAIGLLRQRYPQYVQMAIETQPVIALRVESVVSWGDLVP